MLRTLPLLLLLASSTLAAPPADVAGRVSRHPPATSRGDAGPTRGADAADPLRPERLPRRPGGTPGRDGAGRDHSSAAGLDEDTRWEAAKAVLRRLGEAYTQRDLKRFLDQFTPDAALDGGVLRNAVQEDFQQESEVHLDFELYEYRLTFATLTCRLRWLRTAVLQGGSPAVVQDGYADVLFDRLQGMRIKAWRGAAPFGGRDPQLAKQLQAGDPNDEVKPDAFGKADVPETKAAPSAPVPPIEMVGTHPAGSGNAFCLDVDGASPTMTSGTPCPATADLQVTTFFGTYAALAVNGAFIRGCGSSPLSTYQALTSAVATNVIGNGPGSTVFGILTASPTYALVEVNYDTGTPQYTVQLMRASTPTIYANGTLTCP